MIFYVEDSVPTQSERHVADLKGLFSGVKAAFLVGGAPSLKTQPYHLFEQRGVVTFAMNNTGCLFRPTCMVASDDPRCFDRRLLMDPAIMKFMWSSYAKKGIRDGDAPKLGSLPNLFYYDSVVKKRDSALLQDSLPVDWKRNTLFLGISIMYHLGIRNIILAGSDFGPDDKGSDYSVGASLSDKEKIWNNVLYKYEVSDLVRLKDMFAAYGLTFYDTSVHSKICQPAGPYRHLTLEEGIDMCLDGFPKEFDKDLPHVSRLHGPELMEAVVNGRYTVVDEAQVLNRSVGSANVMTENDVRTKNDKEAPAAPL